MRRGAGWRQVTRWRPAVGRLAGGGLAVAAALVFLALPAVEAAVVGGRAGAAPAGATASGSSVLAWGVNNAGQLGDGTTTERLAPVKVSLPQGVTVTSVRTSCAHTLAVTSTGQVLAWGDNQFGQLGDGTTSSSDLPVQVSLPPGTTAAAVRPGCVNSFALTSTGRVLAWGYNKEGELGDGTTVNSDVPVPVMLPPGTVVRVISAGATHTLALTSTGQVLAWGINVSGQLGDGTTTTSGTPVQTQIPPGVTVTAVAAGGEFAGGEHSLALTSAGLVLAWGDNIAGELGDGSTTDRHVPVFAHLPQGAKIRGLFGGCFHTLALTTTGQVLAWGDNQRGQLGDGTTTERHLPVRVAIPSGTTVTAITAGCDHNLVATSNGGVLAWGIANDGELGTGTQPPIRKNPVQVKLPSGVTVTSLGLGSEAFSSFAIVKKVQ